MEENKVIQYFLKKNPFSAVTGDLISVESLKSASAISGESFSVIGENGNFKLRFCSSRRQAVLIEKNVGLFPHIFTKFYGRSGRLVLFAWSEGQVLTKPISEDICYKMGKLVGEVHKLNDLKQKNPDTFFEDFLSTIGTVLSSSDRERIREKYSVLRKGLSLAIVLEINDIHPANFMIDRQRLYFVDEAGMGHKIKGLGLAKPFFTSGFLKTHSQQEAFWAGYNEHSSNDWFDTRYKKFVTFLQLVRSLAAQVGSGANLVKIEKIKNQLLMAL